MSENEEADFPLDPSDPLYMLLNNAQMDLDFTDPSFAVYVNPNALFIDGKAPVHSAPILPLQPQDLLNSFAFSSPTLSSASASDSPSGFSPSSPGSVSSPDPSPAAHPVSGSPPNLMPAFFPPISGPFVTPFQPSMAVPQPLPPTPSPPPPIHTAQGPQTHVINTATGRPKTSHTTIERRYRTNLNARIQSLKAAVPALRVLDQNCKSDDYKVDDRGYIDGVKVARKGSKANVLGKAVEYIRVLKRRESRLKREQDGLRTLIRGFPAGQKVLADWENEWTKKFGGPEMDEIENEGAEEASDDDEGDGDGEDDGDGSERARKKPKTESFKKEKRKIAPATPVSAAPAGEAGVPSVVAEKRKRGRPRKIQPNIPPPITPVVPILLTDPAKQTIMGPPTASLQAQPQQYLLAVFALFSFFNSPLTSTSQPASHHHTHEGSVLFHTASPVFSTQPAMGWAWNDVVQVVHLLASLAVFISIVIPWIPIPRKAYQSQLMQLIPFASLLYQTYTTSPREVSDLPTPPNSPAVSDSDSEPDSSSTEYTVRAAKEVSNPLVNALSCKGAADELDNLLSALHVSTGWFGMLWGSLSALHLRYGSKTQRELRAWTRLAELIVLSAGKTSMPVRWQAYSYLSRRSGPTRTEVAPETLVSDFCTLALLAQSLPLAETRSQALWIRARGSAESVDAPAYQRLVLDSMSAEEAMECIGTSKPISSCSPLELLALNLLHKRLHSHASSLFIHRVSQGPESDSELSSTEDPKTWRSTLSYGRSLGGDIALLSDVLARVWQDRWFSLDISDLKVEAANEDILTLLQATVLYSQVFASQSVPSPPPSPSSKVGNSETDVVLHLRCLLGSSVFEESEESNLDGLSLEDARDRVVDMIVSLQRERRTRVG